MKKKLQYWIIFFALLLSGTLGLSLSWYLNHEDRAQEIQIIETYHYPARFVEQLKGDPDAGRKIFNEFCTVCHGKEPSINIPAPRIGDKQAWGALRKAGIKPLLKITIDGAGAMPARGGCFECSDEQLEQTISYILKSSE